MYRANRSIPKYSVCRCHISRCNRVQYGCHADNRCRFADMGANSVLSLISVLVYFRQRTVVTNRAVQHERYIVFHAVVNDTAVNALPLDKRRDGAVSVNRVDCIQMVVVAHEMKLLIYDVASECGSQVSTLEVMRRERVSRKQCLTVALCNQFAHYAARFHIEAARRTQNPDNIAVVFFFVFQQFD